MQSSPDILGAADDLNRFPGTDIHLADAEFVGIGMLLALLHQPQHHALGPGAQIFDLLLLKSGHRKTMSQFVDGSRQLNQLLEPRE